MKKISIKEKKKKTSSTQNKISTKPESSQLKESEDVVQQVGKPELIPAKKASIYIAGESPMVEQYAELCTMHGCDVFVSFNIAPTNILQFKSDAIKYVKIIPTNVSLSIELTNTDPAKKRINIETISNAVDATTPILSSSITITATEQCSWIQGKHRLVGFAALPSFIDKPLVEVAPTIYTPKETIEVINVFFHSIGKKIEIVQDRIGMVLPRILCQIINEAAFAITEDIATPQDIDLIAKLCINFPAGPIELAEKIGTKQIYYILKALHDDLQEERYRIAPLLKQMALTGEWWKNENN